MLCYLLTFLFLFSPAYSYDDDYEDYQKYNDEDQDFEPGNDPQSGPVTYGGITFVCDYGCADPTTNPDFCEISAILREAIDRAFSWLSSPLYIGWSPLEATNAYPFYPWIQDWWDEEYKVYDWEATKGFYLSQNPRKEYAFNSYPAFLELASALRRDVHFYSLGVYEQELEFSRSTLSSIRKMEQEGKYGSVRFDEEGHLEFCGSFPAGTKSIRDCIEDLTSEIKRLEENLSNYYPYEYEKNKEIIEEAIRKVDREFRFIFTWCLEHHQPEGIAFQSALEGFIGQDFYEAIEQIRWLIEIAEKHQVQDELLSKLYLLKGEVQSEYGLYADAIIGLTTAIQKNPQMKEAYFERAAAYFETGQFDRAIEDYLNSNMRPSYFESPSQVGLGIAAGIVAGAESSTHEFIPTMLSTAEGLGAGIWALLKSPVSTSQEFVNAALQCVEYIYSHSPFEVVQAMVPELRELVQNYPHLKDFQKGELLGHAIGKYGLDILITKGGITFLKSYKNLKKANKVLTLEALASSGTTQTILAQTERRWSNIHIAAIRKGEVKIVEAKQGKHIVGHKNYENLIKLEQNPSIFTHPDPQKLLTEYGGTGIKAIDSLETTAGVAGYREIVDFKQVIGYAVEEKTKIKTATTMGKIHYAKDGAHIVPFVKR